jgi:hypothetical protein
LFDRFGDEGVGAGLAGMLGVSGFVAGGSGVLRP